MTKDIPQRMDEFAKLAWKCLRERRLEEFGHCVRHWDVLNTLLDEPREDHFEAVALLATEHAVNGKFMNHAEGLTGLQLAHKMQDLLLLVARDRNSPLIADTSDTLTRAAIELSLNQGYLVLVEGDIHGGIATTRLTDKGLAMARKFVHVKSTATGEAS